MTRHLALLRGINVGGNNLIKMPALKACFEALGLDDVATYIASGNVLFSAPESPQLAARIEEALGATFRYQASVVLRTQAQLRRVVRGAPSGFGERPAQFRYDVIFLKAPLTAKAALRDVPTREGVDQVSAGSGVLYFSRLASKAAQSRLSKIVSLPIYKSMTIRNWNTTSALLRLMDEGA